MMSLLTTDMSSGIRRTVLRGPAVAPRAVLHDLRHILSTLRRHRIITALIVLEVAMTCAIVTNALHLMRTRVDRILTDTGLVESELFVLETRHRQGTSSASAATEDLLRIRALPGVKAATATNQVVYGSGGSNHSVQAAQGDKEYKSEQIGASQYFGDEQWLPTLGLKLVEGRNFTSDEVQDVDKFMTGQARIGQIIINKALADRLFPGRSALGQTVYVFGPEPSTVIGIVETMTHPALYRAGYGAGNAVLSPLRGGQIYIVRGDSTRLAAQIKAAVSAIERSGSGRKVTGASTLLELRASFYAQDRAMAWLMLGVCVVLMLVTAIGVVGLASFWVQQRTRMIGIRRALGATESQIRRYFQLENLLLTSTGILIGVISAITLSQLLMQRYGLPRLPWVYLPVSAMSLLLLGQLAVWSPARRGARVTPVAALRS